MIAYKFLDQGRVAPFTGVRWPEPAVVAGERPRRAVPVGRARLPGPSTCPTGCGPSSGRWNSKATSSRASVSSPLAAAGWSAASRPGPTEWRCIRKRPARRRPAGVHAASPDLEEYAADAEGAAERSPRFAAFASARLAELQDGSAGLSGRARATSALAARSSAALRLAILRRRAPSVAGPDRRRSRTRLA